MKYVLTILFIGFLCLSQVATAGTKKDKELYDQASELSYKGQLKLAEKLAGQETPEPVESKGDDWSGTSLFLSMIWGAIGTGYFIYGKKQSRFTFLICGIGLMVVPYFLANLLACTVICLAMFLAPFKVEL